MGALAHTLVSLSGPSAVTGIIPEALVKYEQRMTVNSVKLTMTSSGSRTVVKDMHARKHLMVQNVIMVVREVDLWHLVRLRTAGS